MGRYCTLAPSLGSDLTVGLTVFRDMAGTFFVNLYTLLTSVVWLVILWHRDSETHPNRIAATILFAMVLAGEFGDRIIVILLAKRHVKLNSPAMHSATPDDRTPLLHNHNNHHSNHRLPHVGPRFSRLTIPPTWSTVATVATLLGGPPAAYLWFELGDRRGPRRGFIRRYRFVITFSTSVFRGLFIAALFMSIPPFNFDDPGCTPDTECGSDRLKIIFAIIAIIISSITTVSDLFALLLTFFGIRLGLQKGEEDEDESASAAGAGTGARTEEEARGWTVYRRTYSQAENWVSPIAPSAAVAQVLEAPIREEVEVEGGVEVEEGAGETAPLVPTP
ncbi:hypothetical protein HK101_001411 [Irineochytrium annulatum]|nr:hypothetical protein HK101_001411 [Irineochytrium annulatum]